MFMLIVFMFTRRGVADGRRLLACPKVESSFFVGVAERYLVSFCLFLVRIDHPSPPLCRCDASRGAMSQLTTNTHGTQTDALVVDGADRQVLCPFGAKEFAIC